jgi:hypothetical protein
MINNRCVLVLVVMSAVLAEEEENNYFGKSDQHLNSNRFSKVTQRLLTVEEKKDLKYMNNSFEKSFFATMFDFLR